MFRHIFISLLFVFISAFSGYSQPENKFVRDVVWPAPNAASLGKYGDIPVSYNKGIPNINIPIYTIQEGPLNLPISLNYHAGGIRVAETASWVGLGWSLNAGGVITRTVLGLPDEEANGYYNAAAQLENAQGNLDVNKVEDVAAGLLDSEPDIFSFNVSGYAGKFIIDKNRDILLIPKQDVKVEFNQTGLPFSWFKITTPDGNQYFFGNVDLAPNEPAIEKTKTETVFNDGPIPPGDFLQFVKSSWYLTQIKTFDNTFSIDFQYEDETYSYKSPANASLTYTASLGPNQGTGYTYSFNGFTPEANSLNHYVQVTVEGKRLSTITTSTGTCSIEFTPEEQPREDLEGSSFALDAIQIISGDFHQKWDLSYVFTEDGLGSGLSAEHYRLQLVSLEQKPEEESEGLFTAPYQFFYKGFTFQDGNLRLPNRLTRGIDHWGFYNGKESQNANINNQLNIPPTSIPVGLTQIEHGNSDRETDFSFMEWGALAEIVYPTGGSTVFTYEANQVVEEITSITPLGFKIEELAFCPGDISSCCLPPLASATFSFGQDENIEDFQLEIEIFDQGDFNCQEVPDPFLDVLISQNGQQLITRGFNCGTNPTCQIDPIFLVDFLEGTTYDPTAPFTIRMVGSDLRARLNLVEVDVNTSLENKDVGGLRIKQIRNKVDASTESPKDIIKQFSYTQSDQSLLSSGSLFRQPIYGQRFDFGAFLGAYFSSANYAPLGSFEGSHISYSRVVENHWPDNGSQEFIYFTESVPQVGEEYQPAPPVLALYKDGQLSEQRIRKEDGTIEQELLYTPNTSDEGNPDLAAGIVYKAIQISYTASDGTPLPLYNYAPYAPISFVFRNQQTVSTLDEVVTTTIQQYDSEHHLLPTSTELVSNSDNKQTITRYQYPPDLSSDPVYSAMTEQNRIIPPVETTIEVAGALVDGSRTLCSFFDDNGQPTTSTTNQNGPFQHIFQRYEMTWEDDDAPAGPQSWVNQGVIDEYDLSFSLPSKFTLDGWEQESYTWESNGLIKSRSYEDFTWLYEYHTDTRLVQKITEIDGTFSTYDYDGLMRLKLINSQHNESQTAMVTQTYQYSFKDQNPAFPENYVFSETNFRADPLQYSDLLQRRTYQYFDGLGRLIETVESGYSPNEQDVIKAIEYDNQGRQSKVYEAFEQASATGSFVPLSTFTNTTPFTLQEYHSSPLNRQWRVTPPDWSGSSTTTYGSNSSNLTIGPFTYSPNTLNSTRIEDPNGNVATTYTDKKGRQIAIRRFGSNPPGVVITGYMYDDRDRISTVLPPGANTTDSELIYTYSYDGNDNIQEKKVPDQNRIRYKYDDRDLITFMQDGNLGKTSDWVHTHYDNYGRPSATGFYNNPSTGFDGNQIANFTEGLTNTLYDGEGISTPLGAFIGKVSKSETKILGTADWLIARSYYDIYGRVRLLEGNHHLNLNDEQSEVFTTAYDFANNILVSQRTHQLPNQAATTILEEAYYDHSGRNSANYHTLNAGARVQINSLSYTAKDQLAEKNLGKVGNNFLQSIDYDYLPNGFLKAINPNAAGGNILSFPTCGTSTPNPGFVGGSSNPDNNDLFSLDLHYDDPDPSLGVAGQLNGNISQLTWRTKGREKQTYAFTYDFLDRLKSATYGEYTENGAANLNQRYDANFSYDQRGNLTSLSRQGLKWDGNCWQMGQIDNLQYQYTGIEVPLATNRLHKVVDNAPADFKALGFQQNSDDAFEYDLNGNLIYDPHKEVSLTYNHLNLPISATFGGGRRITWLYDANGTKLQKSTVGSTADNLVLNENPIANGTYESESQILSAGRVASGSSVSFVAGTVIDLQDGFDAENGADFTAEISTSTTASSVHDYLGSIEYRNGTLEAIYHTEGRVYFDNSTPRYEYTLTDHLGNARLMFSDINGDGTIEMTDNPSTNEVLQEHHYYPFGMSMDGPWVDNATQTNPYQYNGKELNTDFGLDWHDYGARWYDAAIGRWNGVDLLAEAMSSKSSYSYSFNNPIKFIDSGGLLPILINGRVPDNSYRKNIKYWGNTLVEAVSNGMSNPGGEIHYVDGDQYHDFFGSGKVKEGSYLAGNTAVFRQRAGVMAARDEFQEILSKLAKDPETGLIVESIQIYTHSRGASFGTGYVQELLRLIQENSDQFADPSKVIDFVLNLSAHQSGNLRSPDGVDGFSLRHMGDILSGDNMSNLVAAFSTNAQKDGSILDKHLQYKFANEVKTFIKAFTSSNGDNSKLISNFVNTLKNEYGLEVTVK